MVAITTSPSGQSHRARAIAESFGDDAVRYDRTRPHYPQALAERALRGLRGSRVLDAGIGTGLSALPFRDAGCSVLGVEPDERMAEMARARGFEVEIAAFETWESRGRMFDAVVAGQAWHWIDPHEGARKAASVLQPAGCLAVFWNAGDPPPEIAAGFARVYRSIDTGLPFTPYAGASAVEGYRRFLDAASDGIRGSGAFDAPDRWQVAWEARVTRDAWLDLVPTSGGHSRIAPERLAGLLRGIGAVIDAAGGEFLMRYTTVVVSARRK